MTFSSKLPTLVFLCASALALSACGGDSNSSGSLSYQENFYFGKLATCRITNNVVSVPTVPTSFQACRMQTPKLNKGRPFSLYCNSSTVDPLQRRVINIQALSNADIDSIKRDIANNTHFSYQC